MKFANLLPLSLASLTLAQTPAPYTDAKSGITFNTFQHSSGYFFGLALPENATSTTDFIATIGGKGAAWSGVSLGGGMLNKLLVVAWPNGTGVVGSFRKTARYASPTVATGTFTQLPIANGTYVNATHWTYTFLCSSCITTDGTTFLGTDAAPSLGYALNPTAPSPVGSVSATVSRHTAQGQAVFDLSLARRKEFAMWKGWAKAV